MKALEFLDLSYCDKLQHLEGLKDLPNLDDLNITGCPAINDNEAVVGSLTSLTKLNLSKNSILNVTGIQTLSDLRKLNLSNCHKLKDIDGIRLLHSLTDLNLSYCDSLQNLDSLEGLSFLKNLDVTGCPLITREMLNKIRADHPSIIIRD